MALPECWVFAKWHLDPQNGRKATKFGFPAEVPEPRAWRSYDHACAASLRETYGSTFQMCRVTRTKVRFGVMLTEPTSQTAGRFYIDLYLTWENSLGAKSFSI